MIACGSIDMLCLVAAGSATCDGDKSRPYFGIWVKCAATLFLCVLIPTYWRYYGPTNFLWFSDIGLVGAVLALWLESRILASMMLLTVLIPDGLSWTFDYIMGMLLGWHPFDATGYMFDPQIPLFIRWLSLYHLVVPALLVWMVYRLGYDKRALVAQTVVCWTVLLVSYAFTDPASNINCVFGPGSQAQHRVPEWLWLAVVTIGLPMGSYLPVHLLFRRLRW